MNSQNNYTLTDKQSGNLAFKILPFEDNSRFDHIQRYNYYSMLWLLKGEVTLKADFTSYNVAANNLLSFSPYQPFMLQTEDELKGVAIFFHPDFFCIHKHQQEVACNGVLFNNIYEPPYVFIDESSAKTIYHLIEQMKAEILKPEMAQNDLLVSYLKILLITASRLKAEQRDSTFNNTPANNKQDLLQSLKKLIEEHYKTKHSAGEYAEMLNISRKALAKTTRENLGKTLTSLISERIIIEAKRELYLSDKPVKQIAYELGYDDEYYFSRFFKTNADISPQIYRDTVGFGRGQAD